MVEPVESHLLSTNGNSTIPRTQHPKPNDYAATTNQNLKYQFVDDSDDDDVQFVSEAGPFTTSLNDAVDLRKSIFDDFDGRNTHSMANNATHSKYHTKSHTITSGQTLPVSNFANGRTYIPLPNQIPLPKITVANFAKDTVIANDNGANASNDLLNSFDDAADGLEPTVGINNDFGNNVHRQHFPKSTATTSTAEDLEWENVFGEMKPNRPGPSGIANNHPRQISEDIGIPFEYQPIDYRLNSTSSTVVNGTTVFPNGAQFRQNEQHTQPGPRTAEQDWIGVGPYLPQTNNVNATRIHSENQPGPSGVAAYHPRQVVTSRGGAFEHPQIRQNDQKYHPVPSTAEQDWIDIEKFLPQTTKVNANSIHPANQPGSSGVTAYHPRQIATSIHPANQSGPSGVAACHPRQIVTSRGGAFESPQIRQNDQTNQHGPNAAYPNWINIEPFQPQTTKVNATGIQPDNQPGPSRMPYQPREVINYHGQIITPPTLYGTLAPNGAPIEENLKRKRSPLIPIKIVRSTKQYETLVEMGFAKKDIEMALRKCNLDLDQTIDYLSQPKRTTKKQKMDPYEFIQFPEFLVGSNTQQSHAQPHEVDVKPVAKKPANLYEELMQLEEAGGIVNSIESFDCEVCMETIEMKDGMILRNCLHRYCKDCLNGTIVHSEELSIKCPYVDCEEMVQDREIRAVLSEDEYEKFLMKGVRVAQVTISGTVLCNLPDCNGWCICEDVVNEFKCPQCKNVNCIPCKAIHSDRNCREYQDDLAAGDANGIISGQRRSEQAIQDLIDRNEAMKCFKCGILIMKRDGCDFIQCVMCKAGICWATRGPRYGPGGVGDLSGGCQCSAQKKCHKDCRGCH